VATHDDAESGLCYYEPFGRRSKFARAKVFPHAALTLNRDVPVPKRTRMRWGGWSIRRQFPMTPRLLIHMAMIGRQEQGATLMELIAVVTGCGRCPRTICGVDMLVKNRRFFPRVSRIV